MGKNKKTFLLALLPLLLWGAIWGVWWRRTHPSATPVDKHYRELLLSADYVEVEIEDVLMGYGSDRTSITTLPPSETYSVVRYINLTQEQPSDWGTGYVPAVRLNFGKKGQWLGTLCTSYSEAGFNYLFISGPEKRLAYGLHPTTLLRLRELIAQHPEITSALIKAQVKPEYLAPNAFTANTS